MAVALPFDPSGSDVLPRHLRDMLAHADLLPLSARDAFGIRVYDEDGRVTFVFGPRVLDTVRNAFSAT